jgi:2'-5' RNA ligase
MPFGVELYFDPAGEERVRRLWNAIAAAGLCRLMPELGARPHLSLALYPTIDAPALETALDDFAQGHAGIDLTLATIGSFPGPENVAYVAPVVTPALLSLHAAFHAHVAQLGLDCDPYYHPGHWIPHCTLAMEIGEPALERTVGMARASDVFGPTRVVGAGLIEFRPVRAIHEVALRSGD